MVRDTTVNLFIRWILVIFYFCRLSIFTRIVSRPDLIKLYFAQFSLRNVKLECLLFVNNRAGDTIGGSITVPFTSCLTDLDQSVLQMKTKIVSCHTGDSKPVKQEVNSTVILPPLVFPDQGLQTCICGLCHQRLAITVRCLKQANFGLTRNYQAKVVVSANGKHSSLLIKCEN